MDIWTAVKYVLAVIAIMAAAGGIVYLLSGVVMNTFEKKNKSEQPKEAKQPQKGEGEQLFKEIR